MNRWIGNVAAALMIFAIALLIWVGPTAGGVEHFRTKLLLIGMLSGAPAGLLIAAIASRRVRTVPLVQERICDTL